jgi:hypothetical protein
MSTVLEKQACGVRELPVEEWSRLLEVPGPYKDNGTLPIAAHNRIIVAEIDGAIVGYWGAFTVVHTEPVYIQPAYRQRVSVVRPLWEGMRNLLVMLQVPGTMAIILDEDAPVNLPMATKLGFQKVPGSLYFLDLRMDHERVLNRPPE